MTKKVVYLDQNFASNISLARGGATLRRKELQAYTKLIRAIDEAVQNDRIVCPVSTHHLDESAADDRRGQAILDSLSRISCGVLFKHYHEVLTDQLVASILSHFGLSAGMQITPWETACGLEEDRGHTIHPLSLQGKYLQWGRWIKAHHAERNEPQWVGDFHRQREVEAVRFFLNYFGLTPIPPQDDPLGLAKVVLLDMGAERSEKLSRRLSEVVGTQFTPKHSFGLTVLADGGKRTPFVDIYSTVRADMILSASQGRQHRGSDLADVDIASLVIPYVDVFATDSDLGTTLHRRAIDRQYNTLVFRADLASVDCLTEWVRAA